MKAQRLSLHACKKSLKLIRPRGQYKEWCSTHIHISHYYLYMLQFFCQITIYIARGLKEKSSLRITQFFQTNLLFLNKLYKLFG